jgi:hypothetical protein
MNRIELEAKISLYGRELGHLQSIKINCKSCEYGAHDGHCAKFDAKPPAEVQAAGCDDWTWDQIPF